MLYPDPILICDVAVESENGQNPWRPERHHPQSQSLNLCGPSNWLSPGSLLKPICHPYSAFPEPDDTQRDIQCRAVNFVLLGLFMVQMLGRKGGEAWTGPDRSPSSYVQSGHFLPEPNAAALTTVLRRAGPLGKAKARSLPSWSFCYIKNKNRVSKIVLCVSVFDFKKLNYCFMHTSDAL